MDELVVVARNWSCPSELTVKSKGFTSQGHDRSERAYQQTKKKPGPEGKLELTLAATEDSPVFNPAFVIKGWSPVALTLSLDGEKIEEGPDLRVGHRHALEGEDVIIWLKAKSANVLCCRQRDLRIEGNLQ